MSDNTNSDIHHPENDQPFTQESQKSSENLESSFQPFEFKDINSQDQNSSQKQIRIVPKKGSSIAELRLSLKNALQILDDMQTNREINSNSNLNNFSMPDNNTNDNQNLSKPEHSTKQRALKIFRKRKFIPYNQLTESQKTRFNINLNIFGNHLTSEDDHSSVDLDRIANSLGFNIEISDQDEKGEEIETRTVDISEFISQDSQGNRLFLGDRMRMLGQLITIAEGDLSNLAKVHQKESRIIVDE